jgi:hypothetical protein
MVIAGMGICFIPEFSPILPCLHTWPPTRPEVYRDGSLVSMSGRRFSPTAAAIVETVKRHPRQASQC